MSEHRSFSSRRRADFTFDVDGESFTAVGVAPAGPLLDVAAARTGEERVVRMMEFLDGVLTGDSASRFAARLRDAERPIDAETLGEVCEYLTERYSGRPTEPGSFSARPDSTASMSLTGVVSSPGSTPAS